MVDELKTEVSINEGMRTFPGEPFIRFSVKANDTKENKEIHEEFKEYCKIECDNNYTLGIKQLLEAVKTDYKFAALHSLITDLNERLMALEHKSLAVNDKEKKENVGVFE